MASTYSVNLDTGFPGWPYLNYQEYITAEQANAWVQAMQAIETVIGYGENTASPLYSFAYNTYYATLTARIAASEYKLTHGLRLDPNASDIQPIGQTNLAGNKGMMADAGHVHYGNPPQGLVPVGGILVWPGPAPTFPPAHFLCNGQVMQQSQYPVLFGVIGTSWGSAGAGTFRLPNLMDRFPVGIGSTISNAVGQTGGTYTIQPQSLPTHTHSPISHSQAGHNHWVESSNSQFVIGPLAASTLFINYGANITHPSGSPMFPYDTTVTQEPGGTSSVGQTVFNLATYPTGNNAAYAPPRLGVNFIMRVY